MLSLFGHCESFSFDSLGAHIDDYIVAQCKSSELSVEVDNKQNTNTKVGAIYLV